MVIWWFYQSLLLYYFLVVGRLALPLNWALVLFIGKIMIVAFFFIFVRANLPRYRYDQLMAVGWEVILPMSLAYLLFIGGVITFHRGWTWIKHFTIFKYWFFH